MPFGFSDSSLVITISKINFLSYLLPLSFSILFHISFIDLISLPSSFSIFPRSFLFLSLSFRYIHSTNARLSLSPHIILHLLSSPSIQYLFSLSSFLHLNLAIIFLSFAHSLPRFSGISFVIHLSYFLLNLNSLILSLLSCLSVSLFISLSSKCIHLSFANPNLSTSSLAYPFL
jgi:hypothetical protein